MIIVFLPHHLISFSIVLLLCYLPFFLFFSFSCCLSNVILFSNVFLVQNCEQQLAAAFAHEAIEALLAHWPSQVPPAVTLLGGFDGLRMLLQALARAHLGISHAAPVSEGVMSAAAQLLQRLLVAVPTEACEWLWQTAERALRAGVDVVLRGSTQLESDHPYPVADWKQRVGCAAASATSKYYSSACVRVCVCACACI